MTPTSGYDLSLLRSVGSDVYVSGRVDITRPEIVSLGNHVAIDSGFFISTQAEIGDHIHIAPHVAVIGGARGLLRMGHFSNLSVGCRVICCSDDFLGEGLITAPGIPDQYRDKTRIGPVVLEKFANVGANVVIMPGVTLREGSVVGAGALVTESTEPWTIYIGSPAKAYKARPSAKMLSYAKELGY